MFASAGLCARTTIASVDATQGKLAVMTTPPPYPTAELLFFGDIVGKQGRKAVKHWLAHNPSPPHRVVIANVENATHGYGLSQNHYLDLRQAGLHVLTSGNHIWDRKDIMQWVGEAPELFRPANMLATLPGRGVGMVEHNGLNIGIINLIGQTFMGAYNSPWEVVDAHLPALKAECPVVFVDMHAEATAEKMAMAWHCAQMGASAFVGTHTHVQTADNRLLQPAETTHAMGYLTDAGFNGCHNSVIGMQVAPSINRMRTGLHQHLEVAETATVQINAVLFTVDTATGQCQSVQRIQQVFDL
jgi:2',3'-cyclic-nucleotide 2'-phosphodiesterase